MAEPYYADDLVALYRGDCREVTEWLEADVLVTDPPYGRSWKSGSGMKNGEGRGRGSKPHGGIAGDDSTELRDTLLTMWGGSAVVFGDLLLPPPARTVQTLIYAKPDDAGIKGARLGYRRDAEAIYLVGDWPAGVGGDSSILTTSSWVAGPRGLATRYGHPHAKPVDLLMGVLSRTTGTVADPCAGGGSILAAAKYLGRPSIGVEIKEAHCERIANRLSQHGLFASEVIA